jgi:hypothetical protein
MVSYPRTLIFFISATKTSKSHNCICLRDTDVHSIIQVGERIATYFSSVCTDKTDRRLVIRACTHYSFTSVLFQYIKQLVYVLYASYLQMSHIYPVLRVLFHFILPHPPETAVSCARHLRNI